MGTATSTRPQLWLLAVLLGLAGVTALTALVWLPDRRSQAHLYEAAPQKAAAPEKTLTTLWVSDFKGNRVLGLDPSGTIVWQQHMASPPLPAASFNTAVEYVTVAPSGNLIIADGEGMMVQELDRATHELKWQYGHKDIQGAGAGYLHQPDKAYKLNDFEVLINDGNNRRVIIVDQRTNDIVWQYGETLRMGLAPGLLRGNTSAVPLAGGGEFLITDTLEKKIIIIDRDSKAALWEWVKPDAKWLQHADPTADGTFILEDRQRHEVFEIARGGEVLWTLHTLADGSALRYPTDAAKLPGGNVLIAEAGRGRVIEVVPTTGEVVRQWPGLGFVTTLALD